MPDRAGPDQSTACSGVTLNLRRKMPPFPNQQRESERDQFLEPSGEFSLSRAKPYHPRRRTPTCAVASSNRGQDCFCPPSPSPDRTAVTRQRRTPLTAPPNSHGVSLPPPPPPPLNRRLQPTALGTFNFEPNCLAISGPA
ncbi:hypothetical protein SKAU_G00257390 [Synaphobranchus kaupii]|uniref:Uncharacterized protein n=1 Tax=Synaphobranchus kaupii TaxID=118154 RepID=A0A9Q1F428_SYNKA|nr:hypothetical protein SKAU_G00257390 [Synaphobranchus kaupii]